MKKLSITIWLGLIINLIFLWVIFYCAQLWQTTPDSLTNEEKTIFEMFSVITMPMAISIGMQAISVLLLFFHRKLALFLAVLSSFITLPWGLVYIIGFIFSYNNFRFAEFQLFNLENRKQLSFYVSFRSGYFYLMAGVLTLLGIFQLIMGVSMGGMLIGVAIVSLFNGIRLTNRPVLGIYGDQLVITPSPFSKTYQVSSKQVTMKKKGKNTISFLIQTDSLKETVKIKRNLIKTTDDAGIDEIEEIEKKLTKQGSL
ncbi:hypothetical protein [Photorhabdus heterorhabditis]|uniref:Uncharacterized protein n=1 Tax=Photorhabdus heterorhabditis TaxID=880156 RepID=A0A5B0WB47_9GAMM|nr:hypothetical protein [Photorhabdus heterorhabditis]KAA1183149.1 hypothetical protein F0L16_16165 [Photorhabdus heterorhabditis]